MSLDTSFVIGARNLLYMCKKPLKMVIYGGPFWSKLNRIFCLRVELFVLPVYFILLYIYIVTFYRAFFSLSSVKFWHTLQIIFFTMYWLFLAPFLNNFFGTVFELFLVTLHELFLATVKLISGSVMHCVPLTAANSGPRPQGYLINS